MYQEWMDAMPLIIGGCHYNNACQYSRAASYWERKGDYEEAQELRRLATQEQNLATEEENESLFHKIRKVFC